MSEPAKKQITQQQYSDLAPEIYRQRMVIEGYPASAISAEEIREYLSKLSGVLGMLLLGEPVTHQSPKYGWAGWVHWETSGAHFYAWDEPRLFFSVDIYTCKNFDPQKAADFTADFFSVSTLAFKEF